MILFDNVSVIYENGRITSNVLKNVSFCLPSKGLIALEGKSGSGKSTIFNLISLSIKKTSGKIKVYGYDYDSINDNDINVLRKKIVGYIYQDNLLFNNLNVRDNIDAILNVCGILKENVKEDIEKYTKLLKIDDLMDIEVRKLSGGEKERVSILITIIKKTKIVLADEPTASLDLENSIIVMEALQELSKERLVIVSSHDIELLEKYTNKYIKLSYGEIEDINIESSDDITYDPIENTKVLNIFKVSHKIFSRQLVRKVFFTIALSITMILIAVGLYNITFTEGRFKYIAYKSECDYYVVSNDKDLSDNTLTEKNELKDELKKVTKYYYNSDLITYSDIDSSIKSNVGGEDLVVTNYVINNNLKDYDVIISDYTKECIATRLGKNYDDIKNIVIENEITLNIYKTKETNYFDFMKLDADSQSGYWGYVKNWYNNIELNENTFNALRHRIKRTLEYNGNTYTFKYNSDLYDYTISCGSFPSNDNEVMLSGLAFNNYFNVSNLSKDECKEYIGKKITFAINGKTYTFTISGLTGDSRLSVNWEPYNEIFFTDSFYETIETYEDRVVDTPFMAVRPTSYSDYRKNVKKASNYGYMLLNPLDSDVESMVSERNASRKISAYLFAAAFVLEISLLYFMNYSILKNNSRNIGILKNNGISNKDILKLILCDTVLLSIITSIVAIISYIIYVILNRSALEYNTMFDGTILHFNLWVIILFILLVSLMHLLLIRFNLRKINKKENKELLTDY